MSIDSIFSSSQDQLSLSLGSLSLAYKVQSVAFKPVSKQTIVSRLKKYVPESQSRIPGYYDPNYHAIYLNQCLVRELSQAQIEIICRHEQVHSASFHTTSRSKLARTFRSGIKIEVFYLGKYLCRHRLLNEGLVQYFTLLSLPHHPINTAYVQEVKLIRRLSHHLGVSLLEKALFYGDVNKLQTAFDTRWGKKSFYRFSHLVDTKRYGLAAKIMAT